MPSSLEVGEARQVSSFKEMDKRSSNPHSSNSRAEMDWLLTLAFVLPLLDIMTSSSNAHAASRPRYIAACANGEKRTNDLQRLKC